MNPKEKTLKEMIDWAVKENDKPRPEFIFTTTPEYMKQFEGALRSVGTFGEGAESVEDMDWEATTDQRFE